MSAEVASPPPPPDSSAAIGSDAALNGNDEINARPSDDDLEKGSDGDFSPPSSPRSAAALQQQSHQHPMRVHHTTAEESVAYVTVSDPVQHTEGIKGKFTMYRVAYDPPPPVADADGNGGSGNANGIGANKALFPYATSVNRRYSDFSWLFDHLHRERPGAIVPPLPEKQQASRFSEAFIEERMVQLEVFLRRVVSNPELRDAECLVVFLGAGDAEFKKAKKDGSLGATAGGAAGRSNLDANVSDDYNDETRDEEAEHGGVGNTLVATGKEKLSHKKAGIKKWIKEKRTTMQGTMVRSPDDAIFEEATHFISALEMGLKRVEAQASAMVKHDKDSSMCLLEFGLGCDALAHVDDEVNGSGVGDDDGASGIGQAFRLVGKAADAASAIASDHHDRRLNGFAEPLREHLKMVHAAKVALQKRNNRRVTYSTCLNAVDSKKASLHKYRITPGQEGKAIGVESSLTRAERAVETARINYEEVSARVLREIDRFRRENALAMYATMAEFVRAQKEHHERMDKAWGEVLPKIESVDASRFNGTSFARRAAAVAKEGSKPGGGCVDNSAAVDTLATMVENMPMPLYPPPTAPEPEASAAMESSVLNGVVRYRDPLPEE